MEATKRSQAGSVHRLTARARGWYAAPFAALLVGLLATVWVVAFKSGQFDASESRRIDDARSDLAAEFEVVDRRVRVEFDRIHELTLGIAAFGVTSISPTVVEDYLTLTDARARFEGLVSGSTVGDDDALGADLTALIEADLADAPTETFARNHEVGGDNLLAVVFPLRSFGDARTWAALTFDTDALFDDLLESPDGETTLTALMDRSDTAQGAAQRSDLLTDVGPDGRLTTTATVEFLGATYELSMTASPQAVERIDRRAQWLFLGVGIVVSLLAYAGLRVLERRRVQTTRAFSEVEGSRLVLGRRFRASFEQAPIGMAELDGRGTIVEANGAMCRMLDAESGLLIGRELSSIVHPSDRADHQARLGSVLEGDSESAQSEHRYTTTSGSEVWVHESVSLIDVSPTGERSLLLQCQDVTAQRRTAWELMQKALHDELTSLPNRALFLNRLKNALLRAGRKGETIGVLFVDIDRFKLVNDSLGHEMGDAFLVEIARRLESAIRGGDTVARFGGDEFVILCDPVAGASEAVAVAQRVHAALGKPIVLGKQTTFASASIGIALSDDRDTSAEALLRDADAAMYRAKDGGRNRSELFDSSMRTALMAQLEIESQLRTALQNGEIVMHYQAIVDPNTHLATGYEALVRWNHPEKGLLGPGAFLPVAEEAGLIHLIDAFALITVCRQIADWSRRFPVARNLYITTNWSARNLGRFVQQVEQLLAETRINPRQLVIEVTEGFLLEDTESNLATLQRLKGLGVQIAIDDFGTGYSSLSYLTRLEVDFLKIDKSFIDKLPGDRASAAVVGAIADMATRLGIGLVAEGVETDEQLDILRTLGSPRLQGYRFAKPRPAADIEHQLSLRSAVQMLPEEGQVPVPVGARMGSGELEA